MTSHQNRFVAARCLLLVALLAAPVASFAEEAAGEDKEKIEKPDGVGVGIEPGQARFSGSDTNGGPPPLTIRTSTEAWQFGYHGYLRAPMRTSFDKHERADEDDGEDWRFRMPMGVPDNQYIDWKHTNNLGGPWAEMIFSYGNSIAVGNVSVATWNITDPGWRMLHSQLGINQAWVTLNFPRAFGAIGGLKWNVGAFDNRYGSAGRYDAGRFDTYIVGRTHTAGETLTANFDLTDNLTLFIEHGFGMKTDVLQLDGKTDLGGSPRYFNTNTYAWAPYGGQLGQLPAMVNHAHGGVLFHTMKLWRELWINGHFMHSFTNSADKDAEEGNVLSGPDGKMIVGGVEAKFNGAIFGDVYLGYSHVKTDGMARMPDAIEVLHSQEGWGFVKNYYGDLYTREVEQSELTDGAHDELDAEMNNVINQGKGKVNTLEYQYTLSLARLLWGLQEKDFWGQGPDLQIATWGMVNWVNPDDKWEPYLRRWAKTKFKTGAEIMYTPLGVLGVGFRYDYVAQDTNYKDEDTEDEINNLVPRRSFVPFHVISPKIRIKTAFLTHEEVNIQYSRYLWKGDRDAVTSETPFEGTAADRNALMLSVNMWW